MPDKDYMLSTYDNPFNPFTDFILWWKEDLRLGHDCCGTLARMANTSTVMPESTYDEDVDRAMDEIVANEPMIYRKVLPKDYKVTA